MSRALTKKEAQQQQLQQQQQHSRSVEEEEKHASANASAGLNLNLGGALSGAFSSKSRKTTHHQPDGSSQRVEDREERGTADGEAHGRGQAYAKGQTEESARRVRGVESGVSQQQGKMLKGKTEVDHLGIEG